MCVVNTGKEDHSTQGSGSYTDATLLSVSSAAEGMKCEDEVQDRSKLSGIQACTVAWPATVTARNTHQDSLGSYTVRGRRPESVVLSSTGQAKWTATNSRDGMASLVTNVARTITRIARELCFGRHRQNRLVCRRQPRTQPAAMRVSALRA